MLTNLKTWVVQYKYKKRLQKILVIYWHQKSNPFIVCATSLGEKWETGRRLDPTFYNQRYSNNPVACQNIKMQNATNYSAT